MLGWPEVLGTFGIAFGVILGLWRRKRKFDRTNAYGVEQFSSYWGKLGATTKDRFLGLSSLIFLSVGVLILAYRFEDSWGWVVMLPVYVSVLFLLVGT
jgi:hypothetical protein